MIKLTRGNILRADVEALVNTVNCDGYMGRGIALQFKKAYPANFDAYQKACRVGDVHPGSMFIFETGMMMNPRYIINFPTKRHWRGRSRYEDIDAGLRALAEDACRLDIRSIAIPPLGCGLGGLDWGRVRRMIEDAFKDASNIQILLFEPVGAPEAKGMPIGSARPKLTVPRALFIKSMQEYRTMEYRLTLLEIQKLAYFLQEDGQPLRLRYEAGHYGPYAANLNKVLETLEGHFIRGYGDSQKPDVEIELLDGAIQEAEATLAGHEIEHQRLEKLGRLIEGFETPYGMEMLSSVHWLAIHASPPACTVEQAIKNMAQWSERKRKLFRPDHIRIAWERLEYEGWLKGCNNHQSGK